MPPRAQRQPSSSVTIANTDHDWNHTSPRCVFSNRPLTIRADASEPLVTSLQLMIGVLIIFAALMISFMRGTPSVTFIEATPAKWNVFKVIWVPGSPIDWAPTAPTVDPAVRISVWEEGTRVKKKIKPGSIFALAYFVQQVLRKVES